MKFKTLCYAALAACTIFGAADALAQKKSSRKSTSSRKTTSGTSLKADNLADNEFWCWAVMNAKEQQLIFMDINLDSRAEITLSGIELEGPWSVSGNTLTVTGGNLVLNGTSTNGGKTFTGTCKNRNRNDKFTMYNVTKPDGSRMDPKVVREGLVKGLYKAYLNIWKDNETPEVGSEVTVKFTPDPDDPNTGTFKVTGDVPMLKYAGVIKGDYEFGENALITSKMNENGNDETPYADWDNNHFKLDLGRAVFQGYGKVPMKLYLIKK